MRFPPTSLCFFYCREKSKCGAGIHWFRCRCRCRCKKHRAFASDHWEDLFPTWLAAASSSAVKILEIPGRWSRDSPERICVSLWQDHSSGARNSYRYWMTSACFVKRRNAPSRSWVISRNSCDYSLATELIREESLPMRPALVILIRSYKPIFILHRISWLMIHWWKNR